MPMTGYLDQIQIPLPIWRTEDKQEEILVQLKNYTTKLKIDCCWFPNPFQGF
jgi:Uma2 family endonuclease